MFDPAVGGVRIGDGRPGVMGWRFMQRPPRSGLWSPATPRHRANPAPQPGSLSDIPLPLGCGGPAPHRL